jgi:hypothetical protein
VCGRRLPYPRPAADRPRYRLDLRVPRRGAVRGVEQVTFTPDLDTGRLVFRLWPNGPDQAGEGARLDVADVRVEGRQAATAMPDRTTLVARSGAGFRRGRPVQVSLRFRLRLPGPVLDRISRHGDAVRLGSFFPILPWEPGVGWDTDPPTTILAEASSSPTADFDVRIRAAPGLGVVTTGVPTGGGRWRARAVRDFAVAVGRFETASVRVAAPRPVWVVAAVVHGLPVTARAAAETAGAALRSLSRRFGPYPWPALRLAVMPDLGHAGIEYPNLIFLGAGAVGRVTTHEVAHQWFYSLVGNDQARDPVLDEGLATYAMGGTPFAPPARVPVVRHAGAPMSHWDPLPYVAYQVGVYGGGASALRSLGSRPLVDCALRVYVSRNAYGIATQAGLVRSLERVIPSAPARLRPFGLPQTRE